MVLVSLDTVRADHTSLHGYPRPTTPELERIASEGVSFDVVYTMTSTTGPTHATLFTGKYAPAHGVRKNGLRLPEPETTLAEFLRARGYRTGAVVSSFVMDRKFGYGQGFEAYLDDFQAGSSSLATAFWEGHQVPNRAFDRPGDETTRLAVDWLESVPAQEPLFLFVHYFDAHEPYEPIEGVSERFRTGPGPLRDVELYDAEIAFVDAQLGALDAALQRLGRADDTVLVVTTDHGQGFMDHGDAYHGIDVHEESVRGVLVVRWPARIGAGRVITGPVEHADVLPTLLDLIEPGSQRGLPIPGRSLARALFAEETLSADHPIHFYRQWYPRPTRVRETDVAGQQFGMRSGRWKYVRGDEDGTEALYDLEADPQERRNLALEKPGERARMAALVDAWVTGHPPPREAPVGPSDADRAKLRALGYVE
jgi:arylsulfatase A-like enzyme